jgi:hypothetical protein
MADEDEIFVQVVELLKEYVGKRRILLRETTLFGDLGLDGDDAGDFLEKYHDRFHVDLSQFDFQRYFLGEGYAFRELLVLPLVCAIRAYRRYLAPGTPEENEGLVPITIQQLVQAASTGRWRSSPSEV